MSKLRSAEAELSEFSSLIAYSLPRLGRTSYICKQNFTRLSLPITDSERHGHISDIKLQSPPR